MGVCYSVNQTIAPVVSWRVKLDFNEAKKMYIQDFSLKQGYTLDLLEFRALLDDPIAYDVLKKYAYDHKVGDLFEAWESIKQFESSVKKRKQRLCDLCTKYAYNTNFTNTVLDPKINNTTLVSSIPKLFCFEFDSLYPIDTTNVFFVAQSQILAMLPNLEPADLNFRINIIYADIKISCVELMERKVFQKFKGNVGVSVEYENLKEVLGKSYNCVSVDDFECFDEVGHGSFALVIHCRKKTTGLNYAMKIQPKSKMLQQYNHKKDKVVSELRAHARCKHPYISTIVYAFQTETLAILIMPLAGCGSLRDLVNREDISFDMVQFYIAEILSALSFLHENSFIYRDLKPENVLLNADGHVLLTDFGSLADLNGLLSETDLPFDLDKQQSNKRSTSIPNLAHIFDVKAPISSKKYTPSRVVNDNAPIPSEALFEVDETRLNTGAVRSSEMHEMQTSQMVGQSNKRRKSFVGTISYMAPEILTKFINQKEKFCGYSYAVDLWSLGCTLYLLLTGKDPYKPMSIAQIQYGLPLLVTSSDYEEAHGELFGKPDFNILPRPEVTLPLVSKLLSFDPAERVSISTTSKLNTTHELNEGNKNKDISKSSIKEENSKEESKEYSKENSGREITICSKDSDGSSYNYRLEDIISYHQHVKKDLFFEAIDWELIENKEMNPPHQPEVVYEPVSSDDIPTGCSVHDILHYCNKDRWLALSQPVDFFADAQTASINTNAINANQSGRSNKSSRERKSAYSVPSELQRYFKDWEYVSPEAIEMENKIAVDTAKRNSFSYSTTFGSFGSFGSSLSSRSSGSSGSIGSTGSNGKRKIIGHNSNAIFQALAAASADVK